MDLEIVKKDIRIMEFLSRSKLSNWWCWEKKVEVCPAPHIE